MRINVLLLGLLVYFDSNGMCGAGGPGMKPADASIKAPFGIGRLSDSVSKIEFKCSSSQDIINIIDSYTQINTPVQAACFVPPSQLIFYGRQFEFGPRLDRSQVIIPADFTRKIATIDWTAPKGRPSLNICEDLNCYIEQVAWQDLVAKTPVIRLIISKKPFSTAVLDQEYIIYRHGNRTSSKHSLSGRLTFADGSTTDFDLKPATDSDFTRKLD